MLITFRSPPDPLFNVYDFNLHFHHFWGPNIILSFHAYFSFHISYHHFIYYIITSHTVFSSHIISSFHIPYHFIQSFFHIIISDTFFSSYIISSFHISYHHLIYHIIISHTFLSYIISYHRFTHFSFHISYIIHHIIISHTFSLSYTRFAKKNARRLIRCKLKTTVFTRSAFILSEFSYFNLKFGIKQSKIG